MRLYTWKPVKLCMHNYKGCNNYFPEFHNDHGTRIIFEVVISKLMRRTLYDVLYSELEIVHLSKKKKQKMIK